MQSKLHHRNICEIPVSVEPIQDIFITTIHDSIMTTEDNTEYISNIILNEFEKNFNLKPSIKID